MNAPTPDNASPRPNVFLTVLLPACLAVVIAWGFVHTKHPVFEVEKKYHITSMGAPKAQTDLYLAKQREADQKNAIAVLTVFGTALGAALVLAKSPASFPVRIIVGVVGGALSGAAAGFVGSLAHQAFTPDLDQPTVLDTIKIQVALFATLGAGIGLLKGILEKRMAALMCGPVAGGLAGLLAGAAYPIVASLMPTASTAPLIPEETATRILWLALSAAAIGLIVPIGLQQKQSIRSADKIRDTAKAQDGDTITTD